MALDQCVKEVNGFEMETIIDLAGDDHGLDQGHREETDTLMTEGIEREALPEVIMKATNAGG